MAYCSGKVQEFMEKPVKLTKAGNPWVGQGNNNSKKMPREDRVCQKCGGVFTVRVNYQKKFCGSKCRTASLHELMRQRGGFFGDKTWTETEDNLLRKMYPDPENSPEDIAALLPGRTPRSVRHRLSDLGVTRYYIEEGDGYKRWSEERKRYYSEKNTGEGNPFYGKKHSKELMDQISLKLKKSSAFHRLNKDPDFQKKRRSAWAKSVRKYGPNKAENKLWGIIDSVVPEVFDFVGDGDFFVRGLNPDWVDEAGKRIIELYGRPFHDPEVCIWKIPEQRTAAGRIKIFGEEGYKTLIIWDDELKDPKKVKAKIRKFMKQE